MTLRAAALGAAACVLLLAPDARAQAGGSAEAAELFKQGRAALEAKDYATACTKLGASLQLERAVGTLISLAECEDGLHHLASARQHWQEAADFADATNDPLRRGAFCRDRFAAIDKRVPRLTVQLAPGAPPDTTFRRDDVALGAATLGTPLPVDPGAHVVTAKAPGRADRSYDVQLAEGESKTLEVEPGPPTAPASAGSPSGAATEAPPGAAPPPPTAPPPAGNGGGPAVGPLRTVAWISGGVGLAAIGAGAVFGVSAMSRWSQAQKDCGNGCPGGSHARNEANQASTFATISTVGFAAGGALVAAGVVLFVVSRPAAAAPTTGLRVQLAPVLDAHGAGASVGAVW